MRFIVICVAWIVASCITLRVSGQVSDWDTFKPHALRAWKTYREQFDCVAVSVKGTYTYDLYFDKTAGKAICTARSGSPNRQESVRQLIVEEDRGTVIEKGFDESEFRLVDQFSSSVPEEQDALEKHRFEIERVLFRLLLVYGMPIDEILKRGEANILSVSPDREAPNLVAVEMEISEKALHYSWPQTEHPELVKVKVVFDSEKLWVIKSYDVNWPSGRKLDVRNESVGFLGCAVCSRSVWGSSYPGFGDSDRVSQIDVTTLTFSIISSELVRSKIVEAQALIRK
jgi:hypothetical protein